jgi:hypothetical protein
MFLISACGASRLGAPVIAANAPATTTAPTIAMHDTTTTAASESVALPEHVEAAPAPAAPWSAERLAQPAAPRALLQAWRRADNSGWCAPLAPTSLGAGEGARARSGAYAGGWSLEFDQRGSAGMTAAGEVCETCGRGSFGIAGTSMSAEEAEDLVGATATVLADGGRIDVQTSSEDPASVATIVVPGQDCVYQVWTFLGRAHLDQLVASLRLVDAT